MPPARAPERAPTPGGQPPDVADPDAEHRARRDAWIRFAVFGVALAGAVVVGWVIELPRVSLCTFQNMFGKPCPGCGMTRSIAHLARGELGVSLRLHPLGLPLLAGSLLGFLGAAAGLLTGRDPFWALVERRATWIAAGLLTALILLWVVRAFVVPEWSPNAPGPPGPTLWPPVLPR